MDAPVVTSGSEKPLPKQVRAMRDRAQSLQDERKKGISAPSAPATDATKDGQSQPAATPAPAAAPNAAPAPAAPSPAGTPTPDQGASAPSPLTAAPKPAGNDGPIALVEGKDAKHWNDRYKSTLGVLRAERENFDREKEQLEEQVANLQIELAQARQPAATAPKLDEFLSAEQIAQLGDDRAAEVLELAMKVAKQQVEAQVKPLLDAAKQREERATHREMTAARRQMWDTLVDAVPEWKAINDSHEFKAYCLEFDDDWNEQRQERIQRAMASNDGRMLAGVFTKFLKMQPAPAADTRVDPPVHPSAAAAGGAGSASPAPAPAGGSGPTDDGSDPYDVAITSRKQITDLYTKLARDRNLSDKAREAKRRLLDTRVNEARASGRI